jgi:hypothetical protein
MGTFFVLWCQLGALAEFAVDLSPERISGVTVGRTAYTDRYQPIAHHGGRSLLHSGPRPQGEPLPDATDEFVTVFASRSHDAEIEAEAIHGLLESSGIESLIVRENVLEMPVGRVSVKVFSSYKAEAEQLIQAAQAPRNDESADNEDPEA